jgi:hypothetical protein
MSAEFRVLSAEKAMLPWGSKKPNAKAQRV